MSAALETMTHREIPLAQLRPSQTEAQQQRRKSFDKAALQQLADSLATAGLVQAILVRPRPANGDVAGHYEIVAGERRFIAAGLAGLERIPCNVRELTDEQVLELQLIENLHRTDLHPMHEAESYAELRDKYGHAVEEIAPQVGKSRAYVYGRIKLLALSKACRKAFYEGGISASIAEKLARIPVEKLQDEALEAVLGYPHAREAWKRREPMTFREAAEHIAEKFMLDLRGAPFPTADPHLAGAGPCGACPKRTGNAPDLFGDVKSGDVCTDTVCFTAKTNAYGQRQLAEAKREQRRTIIGKEAEKIVQYGIESSLQEGYHRLDDEIWLDNGKRVTAKKLLKDGERPALLQDPKSKRVIEVVHNEQLDLPKRAASSGGSSDNAQRKKAELENKFRRALYTAIRPKLGRPSDLELARAAYKALDAELQKVVWQIRGVELVKPKHYGNFDRDAHEAMIDKLSADELASFMNDCIYAPTLRTNTWSSEKTPARLLAAAKAVDVDAAKLRRELTPKKKPAKKKAGRKA